MLQCSVFLRPTLASETTHVAKNATKTTHASPMLNIGARRRCVAGASPAQQRRTLAERQCERSLRWLSLIEPGPVITEFERKVFEDGMKMDLSAADKETADMFTNVYLKNYKSIFQSLGQTAEDVAEHTMKIILSENPPFRHQTNNLYTPMTTLKYADPNGDLPIDTFYKMVFQHDKIFNASLNFIKLLRWRSKKSFEVGKPQS
ncbi:unnamed protein product [Ranitomeya imitator]|uniref:Uncharacterized protein n=1 Tax=Ranitomeya imitator TaxID=111125 RepID=A0ABN9KV44_9NEOB|nr:unnamed protein product [Ranitomeya imitator]